MCFARSVVSYLVGVGIRVGKRIGVRILMSNAGRVGAELTLEFVKHYTSLCTDLVL